MHQVSGPNPLLGYKLLPPSRFRVQHMLVKLVGHFCQLAERTQYLNYC